MNEYYLNDYKKRFYNDALELIRNCTDDFWDLDDGLDKYIDQINSCENVRTMYSYYGNNKHGIGFASYLFFCYTSDFEDKVLNFILPRMKDEFGYHEFTEFEVHFEAPKVQKEDKVVAPYLKFINHKDYWNINHIKIELTGGSNQDQKNFWKTLANLLTS